MNNKLPKQNCIFIFAVITVFLSLGYYSFYSENIDTEGLLKQVVPQATCFEKINREPLTYEALKGKETIGYCSINKASGYQSNVTMLVAVDPKGVLIGNFVVSQGETPSFFNKLFRDKFFLQFSNANIKEGFELGKNVDAVSGATVSSLAVTKAVNKGAKHIGDNYLNIRVNNPYAKVVFGLKEILLIIFLLLSFYLSENPSKQVLRILILMLSIVILGFHYNVFITYGTIVSLLGRTIPSIEKIDWYILIFGTLVIVLITGKNLWCHHTCPFGAVQELIYKLLKLKQLEVSTKLNKLARNIPGFLAWLAITTAFVSGNFNITNYEPFATLFGSNGTAIHWILLPLLLFISLFINRFWCKYFCPVGYTLNLIVRFKRSGVKIWDKIKPGKTISS